MRKKILINLVIFIISSINVSYSMKLYSAKDSLILMVKRGNGIFIYNWITKKDKKIFSFKNEWERMDVTRYKITEENIYFKIYNIKEKVDNIKNDGIFYEKYYIYSLEHNELYLFKDIRNHILDSTLYVTETFYSKDGQKLKELEYKTDKLPEFERGPKPQKSRIVNNIQIIAKKGNLYIKNIKNDEIELLLEYRIKYNEEYSKFVQGYAFPDLSRDGKRVIFIDSRPKYNTNNTSFFEKFRNFFRNKTKTYMIELDLISRKKRIYILDKYVYFPKYSYSNQLILFFTPKYPSLNEYYIFDLKTKEIKEIPSCEYAFWVY